MKTELKKIIKKYYIIIWIAVVSAALIAVGTYAAYTNINKVKRVVSTQGSTGTAFSSNYLSLVTKETENYDSKRITINKNATEKNFDISIFNYVQNNPSVVNENDITYTMKFTLVSAVNGNTITDITGYADNDKFSISCGGTNGAFENGVCTFADQTLAGKTKSSIVYSVTVPSSFIDTVNIKAEAVPDNTSYSYTDQCKLTRILAFSEYSEEISQWSGSFRETTVSGYDGFNYILKGQGKGTVTLKWKADQLEINKIFLIENRLAANESDGWTYVTFSVDSDEKNQYNIQFYKTDGGNYDDISGYVKTEYVKSAASESVSGSSAAP